MMNEHDAVAQHAQTHPLDDRLRGRAFIPGVHYVTQAQAWMIEAADELERLRALTTIYTASSYSHADPADYEEHIRNEHRHAAATQLADRLHPVETTEITEPGLKIRWELRPPT